MKEVLKSNAFKKKKKTHSLKLPKISPYVTVQKAY